MGGESAADKPARDRPGDSELLAALLRETTNLICVKDRDGRLLAVSSAIARLLGRSEEDLLGKDDLESLPRDQARQIRDNNNHIMHTGIPETVEESVDTPAGRRTFLFNKSPYRDAAGNVVGIVGVGTDVTERRRQEEAALEAQAQLEKRVQERTSELSRLVETLRQEAANRMRAERELADGQERLRAVLASMDDLLFVMDREGRLIDYYQGNRVADLYLPPAEFLGKRFQDVLPPDVSDKCARAVEDAARTGQIHEIDYALDMPGGRQWYSAKFSAIHDGGGGIVGVTVVARNITARVRMEDALRTSEARFRAFFEQSPVAMWEMDLSSFRQYLDELPAKGEGDLRSHLMFNPKAADEVLARTRVLAVNDAMVRLHEASTREELRTHYSNLAAAGTREAMLDARVALSRGATSFHVQTDSRTITGRRIDVILDYLVLPECETTWDRVLLAVTDVTAVNEARAALQAIHRERVITEEAERRRLARELHDSVAQDLVALDMSLHSLGEDPGISDAAGKVLLRAAQRCGQIVRDIRTICHGLYPPTLETLGLGPSFRQLIKGCTEAGLVAQLLMSPEVAARRFSPDVEIAVFRTAQEAVANVLRHSQAANICLQLLAIDGRLVLAVTDNGKGFDPDLRTPTGVGLVSMRERAQSVGGDLRIDSRPGGTTLFLHVPLPPSNP